MTNKQITIEGKTIFYRTGTDNPSTGPGPCVLLVHGFGEDGSIWKNQVERLEKDYFLIVPDLPGSGQSEMIADMSMEGMAEVIEAILMEERKVSSAGQRRDVEGAFIIGHSMGGYITLAFAEKYPSQLAGFGLFHSTAYADNEEKKANRRKGIEFIREHGAFAFLETATPKLFSEKTKKERPELVSGLIDSLRKFSAEALIAYYEAMMQRPDRTAVLRKTTVPVLFIIGEDDTAVPPADTLQQSHLPTLAAIHLLAETGHLGMLEKPAESTRFLLDFLALRRRRKQHNASENHGLLIIITLYCRFYKSCR
jgi:pimeloyl-ACP methyl ester carboxylesterase